MSELTARTKRQIALLVGDDLEVTEQAEARQSVESCPMCREHWVRLRDCMDAIEYAGKSVDVRPGASLWPRIESQLRSSVVVRRSERFNGWVPALSMAAACIALLVAGQHDGIAPDDSAASSRYERGFHHGAMISRRAEFFGRGAAEAGMVGFRTFEAHPHGEAIALDPSELVFPVDASPDSSHRGMLSRQDWCFPDRGR